MLESFTHQTFSGHVGHAFVLHLEDGSSVETRLAQVRPFGKEITPGGREAFSLVFHGPREPALPQLTYRVEHEGIGTFDLFLVPVGPDDALMEYEAVFT